MEPRQSPTVRRRRLGLVLRKMREDQGLTIPDAAQQLGWNRTTLDRIENGGGAWPKLRNTEALLDLYGIVGAGRDEAIELTRQARQRGWWHPLGAALTSEYATYIGLEAEATVIRNFELVVVPGLFQTRDYAHALITGRTPHKNADEIAALVEVRMKRQQLLYGPNPLHVRAVMGEGALRWMVGGTGVMVEQMEYLTKVAQLDNVHIHVLPFDAGAHQGRGPFVILTFPEPLDPEVVYVEGLGGELWVEDRARVEDFGSAFERLRSAALTESASLTHISKILARLAS